MQIVSIGDNLHECQILFAGQDKKKIIEFSRLQLMIFFSYLAQQIANWGGGGGGGWLDGGKVTCIFCRWGVQLILAYSLAIPAILAAGKDKVGMFLFLLFLHFHSCSSFFPVPLSGFKFNFFDGFLKLASGIIFYLLNLSTNLLFHTYKNC